MRIISGFAASLLFAGTMGHAATVKPVAYDMSSVGITAYYQDDSYTGVVVNNGVQSSYSGGVGELTDGFAAPNTYSYYENAPNPGGPYVAWRDLENIVIGFDFAGPTDFNAATFYFDDKDGEAGVVQPKALSINGIGASIPVNSGSTPFSFTLDLQGLAPTARLLVMITTGGEWTHLSEVAFDATPAVVPVPASIGLLAGALALLSARRRRV
ncbi:hypothetical protein P775_28485 [Puniceibacterium antarcticum]|uniref:PEP-CTERM protein-sorting domain-containing protein n=1 Tax=Puniceibacterium antarcticum TaxID=1206336 RepID=A0A2G8QT20_9RHOB|nr:PEP-CTERM sorting domain-containing protein [Puniceibacterium antarcticum]PIL12443.1 hypothetical protein P775_28485 [Puniceibacterium antarcticum]